MSEVEVRWFYSTSTVLSPDHDVYQSCFVNLDSFQIACWSLEVHPLSIPALFALQREIQKLLELDLLYFTFLLLDIFPPNSSRDCCSKTRPTRVLIAWNCNHCHSFGQLKRCKKGCSCCWKPQEIRSAPVTLLFPCHLLGWRNTKIPSSKDFPLSAAWGCVWRKENYPNERQLPALHIKLH